MMICIKLYYLNYSLKEDAEQNSNDATVYVWQYSFITEMF